MVHLSTVKCHHNHNEIISVQILSLFNSAELEDLHTADTFRMHVCSENTCFILTEEEKFASGQNDCDLSIQLHSLQA